MSEEMSRSKGGTQAWFWSEEWQAGENEADNQLQQGEGDVFSSGEEFLESVKSGLDDSIGYLFAFAQVNTAPEDSPTVFSPIFW